MKFPQLFRREKTPQAAHEAQDRAEKLLAECLRALGKAFSKLGDLVEAQRLSRAGFGEQGKYLERLDQDGQPAKKA
jgi:hypothetical protein